MKLIRKPSGNIHIIPNRMLKFFTGAQVIMSGTYRECRKRYNRYYSGK